MVATIKYASCGGIIVYVSVYVTFLIMPFKERIRQAQIFIKLQEVECCKTIFAAHQVLYVVAT